MAIELLSETIEARNILQGYERIELIATHKLQIRHGLIANPVDMLLSTVPTGKKWRVTVSVYIEETDA